MKKSLLDKLESVAVDSIETHPNNPRLGDVEAIAESLIELEMFQPIVVQRSTNYILAGNHTYLAACMLEWDEVDAVFVDVDDTHAARIMLAANRTADRGTYDELLLATLLGEIRHEDETYLDGTGYSVDEVDELLADIATFEPDFDEEDEETRRRAAALFDKIMPPPPMTVEEELEHANSNSALAAEANNPAPSKPRAALPHDKPSEYVLFRFGELRAKVPREFYETVLKTWIKAADGDVQTAGMEACARLGVDMAHIEPAVIEGTEHWI